MTTEQLNELSYRIIGAAIEVHREMGPGLDEKVYEICLMHEFKLQSIKVERQVKVPIIYKGINLNKNYFIDMLIEGEIILELKCVKELNPIHEVQLVTYLKLMDKKLGLLFNFNVSQMAMGIKRKVNGLYEVDQ